MIPKPVLLTPGVVICAPGPASLQPGHLLQFNSVLFSSVPAALLLFAFAKSWGWKYGEKDATVLEKLLRPGCGDSSHTAGRSRAAGDTPGHTV